ncbi:MAG TPA: hypothetical protein VHP31_11895 [Caproicibacter sp.]|nr:hypothetical protein [Caproicibacter sp.]
MLKKFCAYVGCRELIPITETYCEKHRNSYNHEIRRKIDRRYDDFYHSKEWEQTQSTAMQKYHGLCVYSYIVEHKIVKAGAVHHIIELREDWNRRVDLENLIPISAEIHDGMIRQMYRNDKKKAQAMLFDVLREWKEKGL